MKDTSISLIVFLGNPGLEYEYTRHNISWLICDYFVCNKSVVWKSKFKGEYACVEFTNQLIYLLRPQTYMNRSGDSVKEITQFFKIDIERVLIVHDELDLPFGTITFKDGGGLAGHKGLKSIAMQLTSNSFKRLRVGIGRPTNKMAVSDYVLASFSNEEGAMLEDLLDLSKDALNMLLEKSFKAASDQFNKKSIII